MSDPEEDVDAARERQRERTERVEETLREAEFRFDDPKYPVRPEELAAEYGDEVVDLPNETESLGDVFDRLVGEEYDSPAELREAVYDELTGEAPGRREANDQRDLERVREVEEEGRDER
ncbi:MAG: hypothetical protein ABEJ04_01155 [Halobacteriaceae archaeon]